MSKHQHCARCKRSFVGPDLNIGENECEECRREVHADCNLEIERLADALAAAEAEIVRLKAVVEVEVICPGCNNTGRTMDYDGEGVCRMCGGDTPFKARLARTLAALAEEEGGK